jgi:hypothetical protein
MHDLILSLSTGLDGRSALEIRRALPAVHCKFKAHCRSALEIRGGLLEARHFLNTHMKSMRDSAAPKWHAKAKFATALSTLRGRSQPPQRHFT